MWEVSQSLARFNVVKKGRRFGFTHNWILLCALFCLKKPFKVLWGDTVNGNIERYYQRYLLPFLNTLPPSSYKWNQQKKELRLINAKTRDLESAEASIIDFRSADIPENWEGFGYHLIVLNEAGIIMKNKYLFDHAVLPMMMDFPDSVLVAGGVPKGKYLKDGSEHPFFKLHKKSEEGDKNYKSWTYTSYDSPVASKEDIEMLLDAMGGPNSMLARQEIFGEFVDGVSQPFFHEFRSDYNIKPIEYNEQLPVYTSWDFNVETSCTVWQYDGSTKYCLEEYHERGIDTICWKLKEKYKVSRIRVNGDASGANDNAGNETFYQIIKNTLGIGWGAFNVPKSNPRHKTSWMLCNYILKHSTIFINPSCKGLIRDCELMEILTGKGTIEIDKSDQTIGHLGDTMRYHLHAEHYKEAKLGIEP